MLHIDYASSTKKAFDLLAERVYDCVVFDPQLIGVDGIQFTRQLKMVREIPFIIYSNQEIDEATQWTLKAGACDYVCKTPCPANYAVLANSVKHAVERERSWNKREVEHEAKADKGLNMDKRESSTLGYSSGSNLLDNNTMESDGWFKTLYRESPIGIEIYDEEGNLIDSNATALSYFGVDKVEDFRGWNIFRDSNLTNEQKKLLQKGEEVKVETLRDFNNVRYKTKKTGVNIFESTFKVFSIVEGVRAGYIGVVRDVTEMKRSEEKVREYMERLEKTISERSNELLEAERMATAGRIASMVGHDLRSPLQSVKNAVYLIRQRPEYTDKMLDIIESAVDRSLKMLDELRQRTREEPLILEPTNLKALVEQVAREMPHPPKITIEVEAEDIETIQVDPLRFRRVLENLINNAVESIHMEGKITVTLRSEVNTVVLTVADQGKGMSNEVMSQLFKPFFTTKPGGMGLGLAFCKRTIEAHGGNIEVETEEGRGTTVSIFLPINNS